MVNQQEKMYKIRIVLDTEADVIRTILLDNAINLETLHLTIAKSFDFDGLEMASFYRTDNAVSYTHLTLPTIYSV